MSKEVSTGRIVAFSLPILVTSMMHGQTTSALPGIYAKYFGLDLVLIGTAIIVVRLFDVLSDPVIGFLSDHTQSRFGKRKPWILAGAVLAIPTILFFFIPQQGIGIVYFAFWYAMMYLAWTIIEIPTYAWQAELSHDYRTRTKIATIRFAFNTIGGTCFFLVPLLPFFATSRFTPEVLQWIGWAAAILLPVLVTISVVFAPQGQHLTVHRERVKIRDTVRSVVANKPAQIYFLAIVLLGLGNGISLSVFFLYIDSYLGLGDKIAYLWTIPSLAMLAFMPVWFYLCSNFDRHRMWSISAFIGSGLMLMIWLIAPGPASFTPYLILFSLFQMNSSAGWIANDGMKGDIVDFDLLMTGVNRAGQYNALASIVTKANLGFGGALGFYCLKLFAFDPTSDTHDALAAFGIKATVSLIPALLFVSSAIVIWKFPINMRRQQIIKRRLDARAARLDRQQITAK